MSLPELPPLLKRTLTALTCYRLHIFLMLLAVSRSAMLSGCSGGGGGGDSSTTPVTTSTPSATTTAIVSSGPITSFGSVILNGIEFDTTQADIRVEDQSVREDDLRIGIRVTVEGVRDSNGVARATRVVFRKNVEGLIDRLDVVNNTLVALGQTVLVDGLTVMEDRAQSSSIALSALAVGQFVDVSGLIDANGTILATRIERQTGCENRAIGIYQTADVDELPYRQSTEGDRTGLGAVLHDRQTIHKHGLPKGHERVIHDIKTVYQAFDIFAKHHTCSSGDAIAVSDALDSDPYANAQFVFTHDLVFHPDVSLRRIELNAVEYHAPKTGDRAGADYGSGGRRWCRRRHRCSAALSPPTPTATA